MSIWNLLRRVRIRGLVEGLVQKARVEGFETDGREQVERFQDYGFAANPVDGEGLRMEVGGHTIILRMDRLAERPQLAAHEVSVWHKEGHRVTLRNGRVVDINCDQLNIVASAGVSIQTPTMTLTGNQVTTGISTVNTDVVVAGSSVKNHDHGNVANGTSRTAKFIP